MLAEDNKGGSALKRHAEERYHKGVEKGDRDDAERVRDHCHTCSGFGVAAEGFGEDDGVQSERGRGREKGQKKHFVADIKIKYGIREHFQSESKGNDYRGQQSEAQRGCRVDLFIFEHREKIVFCDRHAREEHCDGSHTYLQRVERICQKIGNILAHAAETDRDTEKHCDRRRVYESPPRTDLLFARGGHNADSPGVDHKLYGEAIELEECKSHVAEQGENDRVAHISAVCESQSIVINSALGTLFLDEIGGEDYGYSDREQNAEGGENDIDKVLADGIDRAIVRHRGEIERGAEDPGFHLRHDLARALGEDLAFTEYKSRRNADEKRQHRVEGC